VGAATTHVGLRGASIEWQLVNNTSQDFQITNNSTPALTIANSANDATFAASVTATEFFGDGSNLTGITVTQVLTASGISPVADGTYTVGLGLTQNGTITTVSGVITAVQEAM